MPPRSYLMRPPAHYPVSYPAGVDMPEFRKAGGGPKCCPLELRGPGGER